MSLRMPLSVLLLVPGLTLTIFVVGCGGAGSVSIDPLVPVGGTLLVDGKPLDGVVVTFSPETGKNNRGGAGKTNATGAFTVTHLNENKPGLPPGKYTLSYSRMRLPDGSAAPELKDGEQPDPANIQVETFPVHLTTPNPNVPANQVVIPEGGNTKLELQISTAAEG